MKNFTTKYKLFLGVFAAFVMGISATVMVFAAIPSSLGVISGCRSTLTGNLRVVDSTNTNCGLAQTGLRWDKGLIAYGSFTLNEDRTDYDIEQARSYRIKSVQPDIAYRNGDSTDVQAACIELDDGITAQDIRFASLMGNNDQFSVYQGHLVRDSESMDVTCGPNSPADFAVVGTAFVLAVF